MSRRPLRSALYLGRLRHRRFEYRAHAFRYPVFMVLLDLDEIDRVFAGRWLWSATRPAPARFRRRDHLGDPAVPLDRAVRDLVEAETGRRPAGPVRLLTNLRYFGHGFNPVSFYYCHGAGDEERIEAVVAEVHNTPWGERHVYVLADDVGSGAALRYRARKAFHVSPFMDMDLEYEFRMSRPGASLVAHVENRRRDRTVFDATLVLRRREIDGRALASVLARYPGMTIQVVAAIHFEALRLWLKRVPVHAHPGKIGAIARGRQP